MCLKYKSKRSPNDYCCILKVIFENKSYGHGIISFFRFVQNVNDHDGVGRGVTTMTVDH